MSSFPSFGSFQFTGGIKGSGETLEEESKKKQLLIGGAGQELSSGSELEDKEVLDKLRKKRKKERKKKLKILLGNGGTDKANTSSIKVIATDFYIDPNGDFTNLKFVNRNQPIPAYRAPKPTFSFNQSLFKRKDGTSSTKGIVKRIANIWVISCANEFDSLRTNLKQIVNIVNVEPLYSARGMAVDENEQQDYIQFPADLDQTTSDQLCSESRGESGSLHFLERSRAADKLVTADPTCIKYWVDFINLQDEMVVGFDQVSTALRNRIYEKKLAIVERALDENPSSDLLLSIMLELKSLDLDSRQMLGMWDSALEKRQSSFSIWKGYLDYRMSHAASFSLQSILEFFEECLVKMSFLSTTMGRDEKIIYFVSRLCALFKAMGYIERAIALFQALIELNCFSPPEMSWLERVGLFEEFWDSEKARFGDLGANGWVNQRNEQENPTCNKPDFQKFDDIDDHYVRWKFQENYYRTQQWLPVRNSMEDEILDPFQTVVYQDIEPFLVQLLTAKGKVELIGSFLSFLKMPSSTIISSQLMIQQDHFLYQDLDNPILLEMFTKRDEQAASIPVSFPFQFYPGGVQGLFGDGLSWPTCLSSSDLKVMEALGSGYSSFACQVLEQSATFIPLNSYFLLWVQSLSDAKQAEKAAKKILKSQPMNLALWNVYAQLVLRMKGSDEARKIYQKTLSMYKSFPESRHVGAGVLYSSLAMIEWSRGEKTLAISCLVAYSEKRAPDSKPMSPESIYIARQTLLEGAIEELYVLKHGKGEKVYSQEMETTLHLLQNAAMLEYLVSGDIQSIVDAYNRALAIVEEKSLLQEFMYQMLVHLLVMVIRSSASFKPAVVRSVLEEGISLFPSNTLLLSVFGMTEGKSKLDARMRRFLNDHLSKSQSFPLHLFSIWTEIHQTSSTNQSVIKGRINQATQALPSNPSTWILALQFESDPIRRKQLFYEAISSCPYSKGLYLMAFDQLRQCFSPEELEEIYGIMDDKEIRIMQTLI